MVYLIECQLLGEINHTHLQGKREFSKHFNLADYISFSYLCEEVGDVHL